MKDLSREERVIVRNRIIATVIVVVIWAIIGLYYNINNQQSTTIACGENGNSVATSVQPVVLKKEEKVEIEVVLGNFVPAERQEGAKLTTLLPSEVLPQGFKCIEKKKLIAEHSIGYWGSSANRNVNLAVAAKFINGEEGSRLVKAGMWFSFLEIIGDPTPEKGYQKAGMINAGQHVDDYGGGICQVSSTLNSAIQEAGIVGNSNIISQKHSKPSPYISIMRGDKEATVTYDSNVDFAFKNSLGFPIRIKVTTKGNTVTVKIYKIKYVLKKQKEVK